MWTKAVKSVPQIMLTVNLSLGFIQIVLKISRGFRAEMWAWLGSNYFLMGKTLAVKSRSDIFLSCLAIISLFMQLVFYFEIYLFKDMHFLFP